MARKKQGKTYLYKVEVGGVTRYIGITNNLKRRETQHNSGLSKGEKKELYDFCREEGIYKIQLIEMKEFKTRIEAKRYECFLILCDYFGVKRLKQKVPSISDR